VAARARQSLENIPRFFPRLGTSAAGRRAIEQAAGQRHPADLLQWNEYLIALKKPDGGALALCHNLFSYSYSYSYSYSQADSWGRIDYE
jgi:hypothetical protein